MVFQQEFCETQMCFLFYFFCHPAESVFSCHAQFSGRRYQLLVSIGARM